MKAFNAPFERGAASGFGRRAMGGGAAALALLVAVSRGALAGAGGAVRCEDVCGGLSCDTPRTCEVAEAVHGCSCFGCTGCASVRALGSRSNETWSDFPSPPGEAEVEGASFESGAPTSRPTSQRTAPTIRQSAQRMAPPAESARTPKTYRR